MEEQILNFSKCARCEEYALEHFNNRSYCHGCNASSYYSDFEQVPDWVLDFTHKDNLFQKTKKCTRAGE